MQNSTIIKYLTTFIGSVNSLNLVIHILTHNPRKLFLITKYLQTSFRYILKHANEKGPSAEIRAPKLHFQTPCKNPPISGVSPTNQTVDHDPPQKNIKPLSALLKYFLAL